MGTHQRSEKLTIPSSTIRRILLRDEQGAQNHRPRHRPQLLKTRNAYDGPIIHPSAFCQFCEQLNFQELLEASRTGLDEISEGVGGHHWSPQDLEDSAARCPLCRMFREELEVKWQILITTNSPRTSGAARGQCRFKVWAWNADCPSNFFAERKAEDVDVQYLVIEWAGKIESVAELRITSQAGEILLVSCVGAHPGWLDRFTNVLEDSAAAAHGVVVDKSQVSTCKSPPTWPRISGLWHECSQNHLRCNPFGELENKSNHKIERLSKLPTRVVVADYEKHGKMGPFLLETSGMANSTYCALSHCWGTTAAVRTTRENYTAHLTEIKFNKDSKTFLDAVQVCRKLAIPYIWIDSLCIIQHDETDPKSTLEDFLREVKWMPFVYSRAVLTLAATGASESNSIGLLGGSRKRLTEYIELPFRSAKGVDSEGIVRISRPPRGFNKEVWDSTLYTRGWIFQERLLSTRYLHLGTEQWYWQCREGTVPEFDQVDAPYSDIKSDLGLFDAVFADHLYFHNWWVQIVEAYSGMSFLRQRDRFIAMETLMAQIKRMNKQEYAAGIWLETLHLQLYWNVAPGGVSPDQDRPQKYKSSHYIPSWSWLSSDLPIDMGKAVHEGDHAQSRIQHRFLPTKFTSSQDLESQILPANLISDHILLLTGQVKAGYAHPALVPQGKDVPLTYANTTRLGPMSLLARHEGADSETTGKWFYIFDRGRLAETADNGEDDKNSTVGFCRFSVAKPKDRNGVIPFYCVRLSDIPPSKEKNDKSDEENPKGPTYKVMLIQERFPPKQKVPATFCKVGTGYVSRTEWFDDVANKSFLLI